MNESSKNDDFCKQFLFWESWRKLEILWGLRILIADQYNCCPLVARHLDSHQCKSFSWRFGDICMCIACEYKKLFTAEINSKFTFFLTDFQAIGYTLSIICFATEHVVGCLCENNNDSRIYIHDAFIMICLFATICVWRGLWVLLEFHLGESNSWLLILNIASCKLLIMFNCLSSIAGRGVLRDAERTGRMCVKIPIQYFQKILVPNTSDSRDVKSNDISVATKVWWDFKLIIIMLMVCERPFCERINWYD